MTLGLLYYLAGAFLLFLQARVVLKKVKTFVWGYFGQKGFVRDIVILVFLVVFFFTEAKF